MDWCWRIIVCDCVGDGARFLNFLDFYSVLAGSGFQLEEWRGCAQLGG